MCPCAIDYLPVCFVAVLFITLSISFTIAVAQSDVFPWFPTISDTATKSPESNIFGQLVNIAAFVGLVLVYVRYLQVKRDVEYLDGNRSTIILNRWGLLFGLLAVLGSDVVANFPETEVQTVHIIGAATLFILGNLYAWIQVAISSYMKGYGMISPCIYSARVTFSMISTFSLAISLMMMGYASRKWSGNKLHWHADDPGYKEHVIGDAFEWVMVFAFLLMFLTFTKEFCQYRLQVKLVGYQDDYQQINVQA